MSYRSECSTCGVIWKRVIEMICWLFVLNNSQSSSYCWVFVSLCWLDLIFDLRYLLVWLLWLCCPVNCAKRTGLLLKRNAVFPRRRRLRAGVLPRRAITRLSGPPSTQRHQQGGQHHCPADCLINFRRPFRNVCSVYF